MKSLILNQKALTCDFFFAHSRKELGVLSVDATISGDHFTWIAKEGDKVITQYVIERAGHLHLRSSDPHDFNLFFIREWNIFKEKVKLQYDELNSKNTITNIPFTDEGSRRSKEVLCNVAPDEWCVGFYDHVDQKWASHDSTVAFDERLIWYDLIPGK